MTSNEDETLILDAVDRFLESEVRPRVRALETADEYPQVIADKIAEKGLAVGSLVAPVWPGTVGDSAMGDEEQRSKFLSAVEKACRIAKVFNEHGVRKYGVIRIDSAEFGVETWRQDPGANTARIADTFRQAGKIAADHGLAQLSMGMSGDFETAVMLGATHVRVGSALFGARG